LVNQDLNHLLPSYHAPILNLFYHSVEIYQITLHNVAGCVDLLVKFRREEDGVEVAGEAPEDDGGAEDPETKQYAARGP
jgi:hypothetical protein